MYDFEPKTILYIHGMGGGASSRIPWLLTENIPIDVVVERRDPAELTIEVRTYDFDPEKGAEMIASWVRELRPVLIIGESLGCLQAMRVTGVPHILVSPSLGAPAVFRILAPLTRIPGVTALLDHIYKPRPGERQKLHFTHEVLSKYKAHEKEALRAATSSGDSYYAFFGRYDHYRRSGVVSLRRYEKLFGKSYTVYDGTHFMEETYVLNLLIPKIIEIIYPSQDRL